MQPTKSALRILGLGSSMALLASLASAQGTLYAFEKFTDAVDSAGDVDLDGHPDFLVSRAAIELAYGVVQIRSGATGAVLQSKTGPGLGNGFGAAVAGGADLDLDGRPDFVVGSPLGDALSGHPPEVHAVRWSTSDLWVRKGPAASRFGSALDLGGDLNGDGIADVIVGAPDDGAQRQGSAFLLSGSDGSILRQHAGSAGAIGEFGHAVVFLADVTGDGISDYAVGDPRVTMQAFGDVTVFSGASGAVLRTIVNGAYDSFGSALAQVGDVDGDGRAELAIGAPMEFIQFKRRGSVSLVAPHSGVVLHKVLAPLGAEQFGSSVAGLSDYDGDGIPDFAGHYPPTWTPQGKTRVLSGATGFDLDEITLGMWGPIAAAGDVNLDGVPDLLVASAVMGASAGLFLGGCEAPELYCTAKTSSLGCIPESSWSGASSASVGPDFHATVTRVPGKTPALLVWSNAPASQPFAGGWLCVGAPLQRSSALVSQGPAQGCVGQLDYTFTKAYLAAKGQVPGSQVYAQFWLRDPGFSGANAVGLTRGTRFTVWP